jgi:hypothetical protein
MDNFYIAFWGLLSIIIGGAIWQYFHSKKIWKETEKAWEEAEQAKEKKQDEIKNTPAADLVAADPAADRLRSDAAGIAGRAKQRLRDRTGEIVSGLHGTGNSGGGGSGN